MNAIRPKTLKKVVVVQIMQLVNQALPESASCGFVIHMEGKTCSEHQNLGPVERFLRMKNKLSCRLYCTCIAPAASATIFLVTFEQNWYRKGHKPRLQLRLVHIQVSLLTFLSHSSPLENQAQGYHSWKFKNIETVSLVLGYDKPFGKLQTTYNDILIEISGPRGFDKKLRIHI